MKRGVTEKRQEREMAAACPPSAARDRPAASRYARPCPVRRHTAARELVLPGHPQGGGEIRMTRSRQSGARPAPPGIIADSGDIVELTITMHAASPLRIRSASS